MKPKLARLIGFLQILTLAVPAILLTPTPVSANIIDGTDLGGMIGIGETSCDASCSKYKQAKSATSIEIAAGLNKEVGPLCDALDLYRGARDAGMITAIAYTAAASTCWASCALSLAALKSGFFAAAAEIAENACNVVGIGADLIDIGLTIKLTIDGSQYSTWWNGALGDVSTVIATAGAAGNVAQYGAKKIGQKAQKAATKAGEKAAQESGDAAKKAAEVSNKLMVQAANEGAETGVEAGAKTGSKLGVKAATEGAETATEMAGTAGKTAGKTAAKSTKLAQAAKGVSIGLSCVTAALYTTTATIKWVMFGLNLKEGNNTCDKITKLSSKKGDTVGVEGRFTGEAGAGGGAPGAGGTGANGVSGGSGAGSGAFGTPPELGQGTAGAPPAGGSTGAAAAYSAPKVNDHPASFPNELLGGNRSAATDSMFNILPNRNRIPEAVEKMGIPLSKIAEKLTTSSPGAIIGETIPNLPPSLTRALSDLDRLALEGKVSMMGDVPGAVMTSGRGGSHAGASQGGKNPFLFGRGPGSAPVGTKEISFKPAELPPLPEGDIWHSAWPGTIFQIISEKLKINTNKIEKLDWDSPLNRALQGLPPKRPSGGK